MSASAASIVPMDNWFSSTSKVEEEDITGGLLNLEFTTSKTIPSDETVVGLAHSSSTLILFKA